jgi:hypothetical protein
MITPVFFILLIIIELYGRKNDGANKLDDTKLIYAYVLKQFV